MIDLVHGLTRLQLTFATLAFLLTGDHAPSASSSFFSAQRSSDFCAREFVIPTPKSDAQAITATGDGAIWFVQRPRDAQLNEIGSYRVGHIDVNGDVTDTELPPDSPRGLYPWLSGGIAGGPDGALWLTTSGGEIWRLSFEGELTQIPIPQAGGINQPGQIIVGPDGALWFTYGSLTDSGEGMIGRVTTSGIIETFPIPPGGALFRFVPTIGHRPTGITAGPDGAVWFTENIEARIGRMTADGQYTGFRLPPREQSSPLFPSSYRPRAIAAGSDGALWFTVSVTDSAGIRDLIGRMTTDGVLSEYSLPTDGMVLGQILPGPDGALWFTEGLVTLNETRSVQAYRLQLGRITIDGTITEYELPEWAASQPVGGMTFGPDGFLWLTQPEGNRVLRLAEGEPNLDRPG